MWKATFSNPTLEHLQRDNEGAEIDNSRKGGAESEAGEELGGGKARGGCRTFRQFAQPGLSAQSGDGVFRKLRLCRLGL